MKLKIDWRKFNLDRRASTFGVCVLIATFIWFLNALSKEYTTSVMYPIRYKSLPSNKVLTNEPPEELKLRIRAYGFSLLRHQFNFSFTPIVFNFNEFSNYKLENSSIDRLSMSTQSLFDNIDKQINSEVQLLEIQPDSLLFRFDKIISKTVPVKPNVKIGVKKQFVQKEDAYTTPSVIELRGPELMLDTIDTICTVFQEYKELESEVRRNVSIDLPSAVEGTPSRVVLQIPVEQFTENEIMLPISIKNVPEHLHLLAFPNQVRVRYKVALSDYKDITPHSFLVAVDALGSKDSLSNVQHLNVEVSANNSQVLSFSFQPKEIEFLLEEK